MRSKVMFMILVILVFLVACGKKEEPAAAGDNAAIQSSPKMYSQLPSFKDVFKVLSEFDGRDIAIAVPETQFKTATKDIPKGSFSLGTLTADAILAVRTRNKSKLMDISKEMLALSSLLGLDQEINQMADEIRTKIEKEQWDDLEASLESLKGQVEDKLYGLQDGDSYTFMLFGGWNEAINKISSILSNKFDPAKTVVLSQKGTLNTLISNLEKIENPNTLKEAYYTESLALLKEIKGVIDKDSDKSYTREQISKLQQLSDKIKTTIAK